MHRTSGGLLGRITLAGSLAVLWGTGLAAPAAACDSAPPATADLVLTGTVTGRDDPAFLGIFSGPDDLIVWTVAVDGVEQGAVSRRFVVFSPRDPACGMSFEEGGRYRIAAMLGDDGRAVVAAGGATRLDSLPEEPAPVAPATPPTLLLGGLLIAALAAVGAIAGTYLARSRGRAMVDGGPSADQRARALEAAQEMYVRAVDTVRRVQAEQRASRRSTLSATIAPAARHARRARAAATPASAAKTAAKPRVKPGVKGAAKPGARPATTAPKVKTTATRPKVGKQPNAKAATKPPKAGKPAVAKSKVTKPRATRPKATKPTPAPASAAVPRRSRRSRPEVAAA